MRKESNEIWRILCVEKFACVAVGGFISWLFYLAQANSFKQYLEETSPIWQSLIWLLSYFMLVLMWFAIAVTVVLFVEAIISLFTRENQGDFFSLDDKNK